MTSPYRIWPSESGAAVRTWALAREFTRRGAEVVLVAAGTKENRSPGLSEIGFRSFASPRVWHYFWNRDFQSVMHAEIQRRRPDVLISAYPFQSFMLSRLARQYGVPLIYDAHNVERQRFRSTHGRVASRLVGWCERRMVREASRVWTVSEIEAENLSAVYATSAEVIPNGVDINQFTPGRADSALQKQLGIVGEMTVGFCGNLRYRPNRQAVDFLIESVWPQLRAEGLRVTLLVVGAGASARPLRDDICFTGAVPDVVPYLRLCPWWLAPLGAGGGTRLKILEALACEKRVLASPKAAEGLRVGLEEGVRIIPREKFADTLVAILTSPDGNSPNRAGRDFVCQFSWQNLVPTL